MAIIARRTPGAERISTESTDHRNQNRSPYLHSASVRTGTDGRVCMSPVIRPLGSSMVPLLKPRLIAPNAAGSARPADSSNPRQALEIRPPTPIRRSACEASALPLSYAPWTPESIGPGALLAASRVQCRLVGPPIASPSPSPTPQRACTGPNRPWPPPRDAARGVPMGSSRRRRARRSRPAGGSRRTRRARRAASSRR